MSRQFLWKFRYALHMRKKVNVSIFIGWYWAGQDEADNNKEPEKSADARIATFGADGGE